MYLGSDALALAPFTDEVAYLEDGDWAILTRRRRRDPRRARARRSSGRASKIATGSFMADKGNHRHFMAKEIHEQPEVVGRTLAHYVNFAAGTVDLPFDLPFDFKDAEAALDLRLRHGLSRRADREILVRAPRPHAGRDRCRLRVPLSRGAAGAGRPRALRLAIGRDRRHARLAALRQAEEQHIASVVNVPTSTMARESDVVAPTLAGVEIGVASTKAFTCQLTVLALPRHRGRRARGTLYAADGEGARRCADRACPA